MNDDVFYDYRRSFMEKNEKKKCSLQCLFGSMSIILILLLITTIVLFISLLKSIHLDTSSRVKTPLLRWNSTGITVTGIANVDGNASHLLNYPRYLSVHWSYTLYVTDRANNRLQKFLKGRSTGSTVAGHADGTYGSTNYDLFNPVGLHVDSNENIYIGDSSNMRVQFWSKNALSGLTIAETISSPSNKTYQLKSVYGLDHDPIKQTIYVTDRHAHQIVRFRHQNSWGDVVAGGNGHGLNRNQLHNPYAVHFDSLTNRLIVANAGANNIVQWTLGAQNWTLVAGSSTGLSGTSAALLQWPADIKLDLMGNLYVADRFNHRIQMFLAGQSNATTIAGITDQSGSDNTHLNNPLSLALDNQLNLYIADHNNHRIQKFLRY